MIEPTAIVMGKSQIDQEAYVGHFSIIGSPRRKKPDLDISVFYKERDTFWEKSRGVVIRRGVVVSSYTQIDDGTEISEGVWIGSGVRIGHDTRVGPMCEIYYRAQIYDRVRIGQRSIITGFVCNDAIIGNECQVFGSLIHRLVDAPKNATQPHPSETEPSPVIEDGAVIGMGAIIIGGVTVGTSAYVAAGAVVTTDCEPHVLYKGIPARACGKAPNPFADHNSFLR